MPNPGNTHCAICAYSGGPPLLCPPISNEDNTALASMYSSLFYGAKCAQLQEQLLWFKRVANLLFHSFALGTLLKRVIGAIPSGHSFCKKQWVQFPLVSLFVKSDKSNLLPLLFQKSNGSKMIISLFSLFWTQEQFSFHASWKNDSMISSFTEWALLLFEDKAEMSYF